MLFRASAIGLLLTFLGDVRAASAQTPYDTERPEPTQGADCQLCDEGASGMELAVPLWLPFVGVGGESTIDGGTQHLELDPKLEFAIVAQLRLRFGPLGIDATVNGGSLGTHPVLGQDESTVGEVDLAAYFGRLALRWHTAPIALGKSRRASLLAIWPYAGGRYALLSGSSKSPEGELMLEGNQSWAEPLVGVETLLDLRRGWLFLVGGDIGGFSIGSEISVWLTARTQYAVTDWLNLWLGWILYYARLPIEDGDVEILLQGPGAGFGIPLF